jgi:hypothetical protein
MTEAGKSVLGRHDPQIDHGQERQDRHDVVAPAAPDEERHGDGDDGDDGGLVEGHEVPDVVVPSGSLFAAGTRLARALERG